MRIFIGTQNQSTVEISSHQSFDRQLSFDLFLHSQSSMIRSMDIHSGSEQEIISRLIAKVSEQALELGDLSSQLEMTRQNLVEESYPTQIKSPTDGGESLKAALSASTSGVAVQRRLVKDHNFQMTALQRQLEITESKLTENIKSKKKLMQDLESKGRESAFYIKKCQDLQLENQQLRHQVEQTLKMSSITAKTKGVKQPLKSVDTITYYKACDDLKAVESKLEQSLKDIEAGKERESQYRMRVRVLEEALEFRSEEIGLAGHADLLAKVAKLRGEVTALKTELSTKHQKINEIEESSNDAHNRHDALQRHVVQLQQRLSQSQQDIYRLQHGDVGEMLKQAEAERDKLLSFVQSDMQKSTTLARQVERLEAELRSARRAENSIEETTSRLNSTLDAETAKNKRLEDQYSGLTGQVKELQRSVQLLEAEKTALSKQLDRKSIESDELNKMQMNLFVQNQGKDEELHKKNEELIQLRGRLREIQVSAPEIEADNQRLREKLKFATDEVNILRDSVNVMEPKLARLEPELNTLRAERDSWHHERLELDAEVSKLRPVGRILSDLTTELTQLIELSDKANSNSLSASQSLSPTKNHLYDQGVSLSQRHSLWVGLPGLRALNATLYESIRRLAHDLHSKEMHCSELVAKLHHVTTEMDNSARSSEAQWAQLAKQQESSQQTIQRMSELVASTEKELATLRSNRITVDQIRVVLASYPGNFADLKVHDLMGSTYVHNTHDGTGDSFYYESKHSDHSLSQSLRGHGHGNAKEAMESLLTKISDLALPELIGRALMSNASSVIEVGVLQEKLRKLEHEHAQLSEEYAALSKMQIDYDNLIHDQQEKLNSNEARFEAMQRECFEKIDGATELAEKQNALTMTLEAKIEKLHRDRQLRTAQLTALQQREESFRTRLLASLQEYSQRVRIAAPPDTSKVVDLLHYNAEILRSRTGSVLDSSLHYPTSASKPLSPSDAHTKSKLKKTSDKKKSPNSSPDMESSSGDNRNNIRARLSPAAQRFVAESADFASSGARRLPSPVVSRVHYDRNVRSPSADTAVRRALSTTSTAHDDLGASRASTTGRSSSRLRDSRGSTVSYGQSPLLHVSRSSVGSSLGSSAHSSSNALQERLREAQRAFAAMRESHQY